MRDYGKIAPQFWTGETGKKVRAAGPQVQIIALYLLTAPSATMLGLYYLPLPTMCHEVGCSLEEAQEALQILSKAGFAHYDERSEHIWIPNMARFQIGESMKPGDKRIPWVVKTLEKLKNVRFFNDFLEHYRDVFHLDRVSPMDVPSMLLGCPSEAKSRNSRKKTEAGKRDLPPAVDLEFEDFWNHYPMRNGKRLDKPGASRKFQSLCPEDRRLVLTAVRNYANSELVLKGIGIMDPHRWLRNGKGTELWRDWITPEDKPKETSNGKDWQRHSGLGAKDYGAGVF